MKDEKDRAIELGEYIRKLRKDKKKSARALGASVGWSQSYISTLENALSGKVPNKNVLDKLTTAFSHIGYNNLFSIKNDLYTIAGYKDPTPEIEPFILQNFEGYYDNVNKVSLEKPYLDLHYLLNNGFQLRYNFKVNENLRAFGDRLHIELTDKQIEFLDKTIQNLLEMSYTNEKLEEELNESAYESALYSSYYDLEMKKEQLINELQTLIELDENFSVEKMEHVFKNVLKIVQLVPSDDEKEVRYTQEILDKAIKYIEKEIDNLDIKIDQRIKDFEKHNKEE